jgi:hypothetical protein
MANDAIPTLRPGADFTAQVTAAVTGKRFVKISADRSSGPGLAATAEGSNYKVAPCGAGQAAIGVAKYDQATVGGKVGVIREGVVPVTAGGTITAGAYVMSDATGQAVAWTSAASEANAKLGVAMSGATAGNDCEVALQLS